MIPARIAAGATALGQELPEAAVASLATLLHELERWNRRINLTSIRDPEAMVSRHVLDSLAVRPFVRGPDVIDIGTGAGFPGLPLAIVERDFRFVLLDSNARKLAFVEHMIGELGLANVRTIKARAEDYAPGKRFDTVIARALASVPRLVVLSGHLVRADGVLLALKGKHPAEELADLTALSEWQHDVASLCVPGLCEHARHVVSLRRTN